MRDNLLKPVLAAALALAVGACAPTLGGTGHSGSPDGGGIMVHVKNHNWSDMTVYLLNGATRTRLGTVTSMNRQVFKIPRGAVAVTADIRLLLDPIGSSRGYVTDPILVSPGQTVEMNVENNLRLTNWAVW